MSATEVGPLSEQIWSDHLELVHRYSPRGLDSISTDWLAPETIVHVHSSLEQWDLYFIECLVMIDTALQEDDEDAQNRISEFLDQELPVVLREWLNDECQEFRIFPRTEAEDDVFTEEQCTRLVEALMNYARDHPVEEEPAAAAAAAPAPEPSPAEGHTPPSSDVPAAPAPASSITSAIRIRRRTLCLRPRDRSTRGKTRKLEHRA